MKKDLTPLENVSPTPVKAGFPNPAQDAPAVALDLNELIVQHPVSTFYMRIEGDIPPSIKSGDIAVVDKSLEPKNGDLVASVVDGDFALTFLKREGAKAWLVGQSQSIALHDATDAAIWGVVTYIIHKVRQ